MIYEKSLMSAIQNLLALLESRGTMIHPPRWQSQDVSQRPDAQMIEVTHQSFRAPLPRENLDYYQNQCKPNLPWADDHFEERVCGYPINPGMQWQNWPWNSTSSQQDGIYNHNYMERYWPKYAGHVEGPTVSAEDFRDAWMLTPAVEPTRGIREVYGDLGDLVRSLVKDPLTRQAYLPVWFPEDLGSQGRKPCTLGYHFLMRNGALSVTYYIRSCDAYRHLRDDIYLTVRLLLWVLKELRALDPVWNSILPGSLIMHISSLHLFVNDYRVLFKKDPGKIR